MKLRARLISAGAGSGKTWRLTELLRERLASGEVRPEGVLATTFTRKAAAELVERVRQRLVGDGLHGHAVAMDQALIGTVNSVCGQLLARHAFAAGLSPRLDVIAEEAQPLLFNEALEGATRAADVRELGRLARAFGIDDWRAIARAVVDQTRANNLQAADLPGHASDSVRCLRALLPAPSEVDMDAALDEALDTALDALPAEGDETKGSARYVDLVSSIRDAHRMGTMPWSDWPKLAKAAPTKKSQQAAAALAETVAGYECHARLHDEIAEFIERVFAVAARSLDAYQALKRERGLVDFVDQEHLALRLVRRPEVAARLAEELDLLLVDEFQDTSPIQLALFLELARLARESVWVGDVKQAIYGFRGTDPELMHAVMRALAAQGGAVEVLGRSWRSRPPLVSFANALFAPAFERHMGESAIALEPQREEVLDHPALRIWRTVGRNKGLRNAALADAVGRFLGAGNEIIERQTGKARALRPGEVAILCRSNANVAEVAAALRARGIPAAFREPGLLSTPEGSLVLACLRRLVDPGDTLASAEIVSLTSGLEPHAWLHDRLAHLAAGGDSWRWGIDGALRSPVLVALDALRASAALLAPTEAVDAVLEVIEARRLVLAWGPSAARDAGRLANLESLRLLAGEYEDACASTGTAASAAGLVLHLGELAAECADQKGVDGTSGAVQVLTHHRAKGLEWPVVIATDLDAAPRGRLWGLGVVAETDALDLSDPLAGRRLRYWPWPFGKQRSDIALAESAAASEAGRRDAAETLREDLRLLYVSLTRAREVLVLAWPHGKSATWLDSTGADWLSPVDGALELPDGRRLACAAETITAPDASADLERDAPPRWFAPRAEPTQRLPARVSPSAAPARGDARIGRTLELGPRIEVRGKPDFELLGNAVHGIIAAEFIAAGAADRAAMAARILAGHGVADAIAACDVLAAAQRLRTHVQHHHPGCPVHAEWPVEVTLGNGQRMSGWIDVLVDTPAGWIIIDHKTFPGGADQVPARALTHSGQLAAYAEALRLATARAALECWIHFPLSGVMVEVSVRDD